MNHHRFPETRTIDRAEEYRQDDIVTLNRAWTLLSQARLAIAQLPELETPSRRVSIEDVLQVISDAITDVAGEAQRLHNGPVEPVWERV